MVAVSANRGSFVHTVALILPKGSLGKSGVCRSGDFAMVALEFSRPLLGIGLDGAIDNLRLVEC